MQYLDFELEIERQSGQDYRVVARSPAGEARATMRLPFDEMALKLLLKDVQIALLRSSGLLRQSLSPEEQAVRSFGQQVFEALISGDVRARYDVSAQMAGQRGQGLRLKLCLLTPELAVLPWEYLFDQRQGKYLCLSRQTPLVRTLALAHPIQPLKVAPPLRILAMAADPSDQDRLDIAREEQRMREALQDLEARKLVELHWLPGQTWRDLDKAMRGGPWHIFHFIGHGGFDPRTDEGMLALVNESGTSQLLSASRVALLLEGHSSLRLALLNACEGAQGSAHDLFASTAATLAREGIPAVLAMQYPITDAAAIKCTRAFYEALAEGLPVDEAITQARRAIFLDDARSLEWGTPVLYLRAPDGLLFDLTEQPPMPVETQPPVARPDPPVQQASTPAMQPATPFQPPSPVAQPVSTGQTQQADAPPVKKPAQGTTLQTYTGHTGAVYGVAWSPDGRFIASGGADNTVQVWEAESGKIIITYTGHTDAVNRVAWSPDGRLIASTGGIKDKTVQVWESSTGKQLLVYRGHRDAVCGVGWTPDGQRIASGSSDGTVQVWEVSGGKFLLACKGHSNLYHVVLSWSPDGTYVASGGFDKKGVRVWESKTGKLLRTCESLTSSVFGLAWSPDDTLIASGNQTVRVWDAATGKSLLTYQGHAGLVSCVACSPDGTSIASGGGDKTVQLWEARTGKHVFTYRGHPENVYNLTWSPDGTRIASGGGDNTVQVWQAV